MSKTELRAMGLASRRAIPPPRVKELSTVIQENLSRLGDFRAARRIASYVSKEDEVQTGAIIEAALAEGKSVAVPKVDTATDELLFFEIENLRDLSPGHFGILEPQGVGRPLRLDETDAILVPLVAWDGRGYRIGYGGGYFDRALAQRGASVAIGLAFESQGVPRIPESPTDVKLDVLVTEKRVLRFGGIEVSLR